MQVSIIICTYQRPVATSNLLKALQSQTKPADEIIIVDGSLDNATQLLIESIELQTPLNYTRVDPMNRGLTRQRNIGVSMTSIDTEIIVFLDDDIIPEPEFLLCLTTTFDDLEIVGADGLITNECRWEPLSINNKPPKHSMVCDGFYLPLSTRDRSRNIFGLFPQHIQPGIIPLYGHGKSSLPPSGKCYEVEHIMGGITAYRKSLFQHINFSTYFEGYGLYEDFDFSVRASLYGKLITNTAARLEHHHEQTGRPNTFKYGKMVVTNGWYVWRLKHPNPGWKNILKWHAITLLLAFFRLFNAFTLDSEKRNQALGDFFGRMTAWLRLLVWKPQFENDSL